MNKINAHIQFLLTETHKKNAIREDTLQIKKQAKPYNAVIVDSGAGGGLAAYVLANAGVKKCLK